jgi:hypothetical protein
MLRRIDRKQDILKTLNLEDTSLEFRAFAIERSRGAFFGFASVPHWITPFRDRIRPDGIQPLRSSQFSSALVATFDMLTLALFAASPIMFRKSAIGFRKSFRKSPTGFREPGTS